jgi:hypothetical protein
LLLVTAIRFLLCCIYFVKSFGVGECEFDLGFNYLSVSPPPAPGEINSPILQQPSFSAWSQCHYLSASRWHEQALASRSACMQARGWSAKAHLPSKPSRRGTPPPPVTAPAHAAHQPLPAPLRAPAAPPAPDAQAAHAHGHRRLRMRCTKAETNACTTYKTNEFLDY